MAAEAGNPWLDFFVGLPPILQGAFTVVVAGVVGFMGWRSFVNGLSGKREPGSTEFAVGDPTTFADMSSIKKLVGNVDLLTMQMMKSEIGNAGTATAMMDVAKRMGELCDLMAQYLVDLREQREAEELDEAYQRGRSDGQRQKARRTRATPAKRTPRAG